MKKRFYVLITAVCAVMTFVLFGCVSEAEKTAAGDYKLSDIEFSVTMGAIGTNMTTDTLKGSEIEYRFSEDFCGLDTGELKKIYNAYLGATIVLKTNKKAELSYGASRESFKWKIKNDSYVIVSGIKLSEVSDGGTPADRTVTSGYKIGRAHV